MPNDVKTLEFGDWFIEYIKEGEAYIMLTLYHHPRNSKEVPGTGREFDLLRQVCNSFGFTESQWIENLVT
jgi:hypothetical protein